ncbi:MAG: LLM class flavin-dependent oxidoreductase, partial [Solirubrobacterales bacterium]|nr:LLM class flavin-dependent oxidoreductase [Solirubrobacterales bacterium]
GGARHDRSWGAAGVPTRGRGRRLDAVLEALPELLAGRPAQIQPGEPPVEFAPAAVMPPVLVGGNSEAALGRAAKHGSGWWPLGGTPEEIAAARTRLAEMARAHDRPVPALNGSLMTAVSGDPALPSRDVLLRELEDPDGPYGIPAEAIGQMFSNDTPAELAERMEAWAQIGVERVIVTLAGGDWFRQAELLAEARRLLPGVAAVRACPG